jgi:hypothetical protein
VAHDAVFQRLPQRLQNGPPILGEFIEEQDTVVREAHFAGPGNRSTTYEPRVARRVVGRPERTLRHESTPGRNQPGNRVDLGKIDRLGNGKRRENPGKSTGHHRLAGPRGADQEEIVGPRGGDLERALRELLPANVGEIGLAGRRRLKEGSDIGRHWCDHAPPREMLQHLSECLGAQNLHPLDRAGLSGVRRREKQRPHPPRSTTDSDRQSSSNRPQAAVQPELPDQTESVNGFL